MIQKSLYLSKAKLFNYISNDLIISGVSRTKKDSELISHIQRMTREDWENKWEREPITIELIATRYPLTYCIQSQTSYKTRSLMKKVLME